MSGRAIDVRIGRGYLRPVHRGVYAVGHSLLNVDGRRMAAVLACGAGTVLSHRSAGRLWGVLPAGAEAIEVTRSPGKHSSPPGIACHQSPVGSDERTEVDGIPVTSVYRTIFDLAAVLPMRGLERAFNEAEVRRLTDRVSLPMLLERHPGRRGAAHVRRLLAAKEPVGVTDRELEERFLAFLDARGFPRPVLNGTLPLRSRLLRPDCMWPRQRQIVELDSRAVHGTDPAFEADRRRDRELLAEGWRSMRVTWRQLHGEPDAVAADLEQALGAPGPRPHPHAR